MNVVLGTGPLGFAVMQKLLEAGERVTMVNTTGQADVPPNVEVRKANLLDEAQADAVIKGADVVFQCAQPGYHQWHKLFLRMQENIIRGAATYQAKLVVADNLYMYGAVDGPIHEGLPYRAHTKKGQIRAAMAEQLLTAHQQGRVHVTTVRASDFFGPRVRNSMFGSRVFEPAVKGKPCTVLGDPDVLHTVTFISDFATALVTVSRHEDAFGQVWHAPNGQTMTQRQLVEMIYQSAGHKPLLRKLPKGWLQLGGLFMPEAREVVEMLYQFEQPFIVDCTKFVNHFGIPATPIHEAVEETVTWYLLRQQSRKMGVRPVV